MKHSVTFLENQEYYCYSQWFVLYLCWCVSHSTQSVIKCSKEHKQQLHLPSDGVCLAPATTEAGWQRQTSQTSQWTVFLQQTPEPTLDTQFICDRQTDGWTASLRSLQVNNKKVQSLYAQLRPVRSQWTCHTVTENAVVNCINKYYAHFTV